MRVLLVDGSPHAKGCTYTALEEIAGTLNSEGVETELFQIGTEPLSGCTACGSCRETGRCKFSDQLNKYFAISEMPVISSRYWNMVHGAKPEDVKKDLEGLQVMRVLGRNMAWFLKCKQAGTKDGVPFPVREEPVATNFIRS